MEVKYGNFSRRAKRSESEAAVTNVTALTASPLHTVMRTVTILICVQEHVQYEVNNYFSKY